ncbi:MAG: ABC transporter permease [Candidatus Hydrogenedentes bacterium]|nr:ABC transporter permease [Candidatus Hydrogenedentota bacterium]
MTLWHIAWNYLWNRKLTTFLTILSVALGVGLITSVLLLSYEVERRFVQEGQAFDIAVGAKGSTQQLVLSTLYYIGMPAGVMPSKYYESLKEEPSVAAAFPITMGDSYKGHRIVGTIREMLAYEWRDSVTGDRRGTFDLADGDYFTKPLEAVLGHTVAQETGLRVGDQFASTHGMYVYEGMEEHHEDSPFTVIGILKPSGTPNDRAIFVDYRSIYDVHEHEYGTPSLTGVDIESDTGDEVNNEHAGEDAQHEDHDAEEHPEDEEDHDHFDPREKLTAVLLVLDSPAERYEFKQRIIEEYPNAVAAVPVIEIQTLYNQLLGTARQVMLYIGFLVIVISSISILIGLYLSIIQRKRDLAIMRALGASSGEVFGAVLIEAFWVTLLGIGSGYAAGLALTWTIGAYLVQRIGFKVSIFSPSPDMISAYSAILIMGMIAGILPAWQAYRTDVARDLAEL